MKNKTLNKIQVKPEVSDLFIHIVENGNHFTLWNRFKTSVWNFILPPHIRLIIKK